VIGGVPGNLDTSAGRKFIHAVPEKPFSEMTLDEMFEFEKTGSVNIGHSGVTAEGFKRHQAKLAKTTRGVRKSKKQRARKTAAV
jgi:hypothetical protein